MLCIASLCPGPELRQTICNGDVAMCEGNELCSVQRNVTRRPIRIKVTGDLETEFAFNYVCAVACNARGREEQSIGKLHIGAFLTL
jgi:hypothetical protein